MEQEELLAGLQLSEHGAQLTWYGAKRKEPQTLSLPGERKDGMLPVPEGVWRQILIGGGGNRKGDSSFVGKRGQADADLSPAGAYLRKVTGMVPGADRRRIRVCVTVPDLNVQIGKNLADAFREAGIGERDLFLQDWRTSFYYYVVNKRRELWNGDVALLLLRENRMVGYILHIDRSSSPASASIHEEASADVSESVRAGRPQEEWDQERDRLLYELLGKMFERRNVTASYLYGTYFDAGWAGRSFQYLTFHRHAFQGQNLFSKGACYGAMARAGAVRMPDIIFLGVDMVRVNVGMTVRVRGRLQYYPLIHAGVNWYEASGVCEVIPESERNITILTGKAGEDRVVRHVLRLDHFPDRPDRATRLRLQVWFSSPAMLEAEARDLGFGSMYPSSGRVWHRSIRIGDAQDTEGSGADS